MFQNSLFMHNTQYSMQYIPSIIPSTRLTQTPTPYPSKTLGCFSESIVSHGSSPLPISLNSLLLSISQCPPCYSLCSTSKWNHMIIDFLYLTYFTQHNLLQSCLSWYKSWPCNCTTGYLLQRYWRSEKKGHLYLNVHSSNGHSHQTVERTKMPFNGRMDKKDMVHI